MKTRLLLLIAALTPALAAPAPALADGAKAAYEARCAMCHGATGAADGPAGIAMRPAPRRFSDKAAMAEIPDERLFASIREGRPGTPMVAYKGILADEEIRALVAYIRTLAR